MTLQDLLLLPTDKKIAIAGLGRENSQFLDWLIQVAGLDQGQIIIADSKQAAVDLIRFKYPGIDQADCYAGENYLGFLTRADLEYVFKAPGMWSLKPELEEFRRRKGQDRVTNGMIFFLQKFREQCVAITGTKGKSTTSSLTAHLLNLLRGLKTDNIDVNLKSEAYYCGNTTNISPYSYWTELNQPVDPERFYVIEMSSFQLQDLGFCQFSPKYSAIVNYYIDHQDQHRSPEEYWLSKDNIFRFQQPGDLTVATDQVLGRSGYLQANPFKIILGSEEVAWIDSLVRHALPGAHNQHNVAVALSLVVGLLSAARSWPEVRHFIELNREQIDLALSSFESLPHRIQLVHSLKEKISLEVAGQAVEKTLIFNFYDDGYATEPDANVAAIQTLCARNGEFLWLQMTGKDKGGDMDTIAELLDQKLNLGKVFRVDLAGAVGQRMAQTLDLPKSGVMYWRDTFRELVQSQLNNLFEIQEEFIKWLQSPEIQAKQADALAQDEIILNIVFSPGGSSFDEFNGAADRADWWTEQVRQIGN